MNWKIGIVIVALIAVLIILNHIPYTYKEVSSGDSGGCWGICWPDDYSTSQKNVTYSNVQEVYAFEDNALVKKNQTFSGSYISTICKCQTTILKKSYSWILNNRRYD